MRMYLIYGAMMFACGAIAAVGFSILAVAIHDCGWQACRWVDASLIDGSARVARSIVGNEDSLLGMIFWTMLGVPFVVGSLIGVVLTHLTRRMTN